jgi:Protein of unknown function (DUF4199)
MEELADNKTFFEKFLGFKFGFIAATISSVWMIYLFATKSVISPIGRVSMLIVPLALFAGVYFSIYQFRKKATDGKMSFRDGFKTGLQSIVAYSLLIAFATFICQSIIYPEFSIDVIANAKERGIAEHVDVVKMNDILNKMKHDAMIGPQITKTVFGGLFMGSIFSLLCAGLMRKE